MSLTPDRSTIDYDIVADVQLRNPPNVVLPIGAGGKIGTWTLGGAVRFVMGLSSEQRTRASIVLDGEAGLGKTWLEIERHRSALATAGLTARR